ncbi:type IV secretory system conjugative DNA transfer family protein [Rossellomorea marisflavi]|uniref:type IV secretory system conjugative DNA transfer family protein n=1 Tax=Rossellomorea marisflavi TaxID=189381 RepID=UPI003FA0CA9F
MKTSLERALKHESVKTLGKNITGVTLGAFAFQFSMFLTALLFKQSFLLVHIFAVLLVFLSYAVLKEHAGDSEKKFSGGVFKFSVLIGVLAILDHFFIGGIHSIQSTKLHSSILQVMLFVNLGVAIASFGFWRQEKVKEAFEAFTDSSLLELLSKDEEAKEGDAVMGANLDTKKPVVVPLKDRYLHMLVLGPTGSGKTSQTIIPMINRDMQVPDIGITVIEPKGDLAEKIWAMAKHYGREVQYFNPILPDCPYFNPLYGDEGDAIENMAMTFKMLNPDSPQFFLDMNENLVRKSLKVLKRLYKNDATLLHLDKLVHNTGGAGEKMILEFSKEPSPNESIAKENEDIALWFMNDYFTGAKGSRTATKTYEHCSGIRSQVAKLTSNEYLRRVLNPPEGHGSDVDFDKALEKGTIITIATAQGKLRELGRFLGYFIILQLQSSVFRRPGNENTRRGNMLYIDEFQVYTNPGFEDMLTQGRSYRVASHLATQSRTLIGRGGQAGKDFLEVVSTNCRNVVVYPGGSPADNQYFEQYFGEIEEVRMDKGISKKKFSFFHDGAAATESSKEVREIKPRFSATDIQSRPFGQITYALMKNNSVQPAGIAQIEFIPKPLNEKLDNMVSEYNDLQLVKREELLASRGFKPEKSEVKEIPLDDDLVQVKDPLQGENMDINIPPSPLTNTARNDSEEQFFDVGDNSPKTMNAPVADESTYERGKTSMTNNDNFFDDDNDSL